MRWSACIFAVVLVAASAQPELPRPIDEYVRRQGRSGEMLEVSKNGGIENNLGRSKGGVESKASSRTDEDDEDADGAMPREEDFAEAADFGIKAMNDLYLVKEPKLYQMGLFLSANNPARYVAAFNQQTDEAKQLARFGYAALEAAKKFRSKFPDLLRQASQPQNPDKTSLGQQCPNRGTPQCPSASLRYRTADGSCNNLKEPWWGSAMSTMQRFLPAVYEDGIESIRRSSTGHLLPSAREVSDYIHEERDVPLATVTLMLMQWGQFIDHDITATGQSRSFNGSVPQCCLGNGAGFQPPEFMHPECLPIAVHPQDSHLGSLGVRCLEFVRSGPAPREDCQFGAREQLSQVTSYIDASTVYSSSARQSDSLRIFRNGLMQYGKVQSRRPVLPREESDLCRRGSLSTTCFKAGDVRLSEQPALISIHVVFLRLHNRLATQLSALNQHWSDEKIFQETRRIVAAITQHITYREFLPIVLGPEVMKIFDIEPLRKGYFEGYDEAVNPNIANEFSTAAYRFGHSLVQRSFVRFDSNHQPIFNNVTIHEEFSNPVNLQSAGSVDRIILGLINQPAQRRDEYISEELTNHLFQTPGFPFGMDLASINIQRGRDHGIPPFADWRQPCALSPVRTWSDLQRMLSLETVNKFRDLYSNVEDIDLFSAGIAEKPVVGGLVGPTFACIIAQMFRNLRKGDRFWYENPFVESGFTLPQLQQIRKVTLAQILCKTMDNIENIQPFVMLAPDKLRNQRISCDDPILDQINLESWVEKPLKRGQKSKPMEEPVDETVDKVKEGEEKDEVVDEGPEAESRSSAKNKQNQKTVNRQRPTTNRINQQNRIIVKRPLGPHENLTIIVNNHAVHSPVFVSDSIYGSNFQINQFPSGDSEYHRPTTFSYRPKPTTQRPYDQSQQNTSPYYPHNFDDPHNPNPPIYGLSPKPLNNYFLNNDFFAHNTQNAPGNRPSSEQNYNLNDGEQETSYVTTKRPKPTNKPTSTRPQVQHGYGASQQDAYATTKRPKQRPTVRPSEPHHGGNQQNSYATTKRPTTYQTTTKSYYTQSNQQAESNYQPRPEPPYEPNTERLPQTGYSSGANAQNSYPSFEASESHSDESNPNFYPRPTRKPKPPTPQYGSNRPDRPYNDRPSYASDEYLTTGSAPSNPYGSNPSNIRYHAELPAYTKEGSMSFNTRNDQGEHPTVPLHTHTTISDIHYVTTKQKPHQHKTTIKVDFELPKPLPALQNRESEDDLEPSVNKPADLSAKQNSSQNSKVGTNQETDDVLHVSTIDSAAQEEIVSTIEKIINEIEIATPAASINANEKTENSKENESQLLSTTKLPLKKKPVESESAYASTTSEELPRPIKLRPGS